MFFIEKVILYEAHYTNTVTWTFCCKKVTFYSIIGCESSYLSYSDVIKHDNLIHNEVFHFECIQYENTKFEFHKPSVCTQTHCLSLIDIPYWSLTGSRVIYLWCIETPQIPQPIKEIEITIAVPCGHVILAVPGLASGHMLAISE